MKTKNKNLMTLEEFNQNLTDDLTEERKTAHNIGLAIWRLTCLIETFVQGSAFVLRMDFSAKNLPHRQAANRY